MASLKTSIATRIEESLSLFPCMIVAIEIYLFISYVSNPDILLLLIFIFLPYLLPLVLFHLINLISPLKAGVSFIGQGGYSPWLGAHKLQQIYLFFPILERFLRLMPGLFSLWLRAWGSKIGKHVYWTPRVDLTDRTNLIVGDHVFFGDKVHLVGHAVKVKDQKFLLYYKPIIVEDYSFIGAYCRIAPGVLIKTTSQVPVGTDLYPNAVFDQSKENLKDIHSYGK